MQNKKSGFTLLEILLVIGIIAILAGIVIVAINPSKQLAQVRNSQRKSDIKQINNAITQYYIDNSSFPSTISTTTLTEVCNTGSVSNTATSTNGVNCATAGLANLSILVPTYLVSIPTDPTGSSSLLSFIPTAYATTNATGTGYKVGVNTSKQVLISAPLAELGVTVAVGNVPTTVAVAPLNISGLVAHYLMNDNAATKVVLDNKGSYNGTSVRNTDQLDTTGKINGALTFNGSSDYITIPTLGLGNTNFTYSLWVKPTDLSGGSNGQKIFFNANSENSVFFQISYSNIGVSVYNSNNTGTYLTGPVANINEWVLVTFTYDGTTATLYINGSYFVSSLSGNPDLNNGGFVLGRFVSGYTAYYTGYIDDVRIYNIALSQAQITALYNVGGGTEAE